jgi:hypothetical protein
VSSRLRSRASADRWPMVPSEKMTHAASILDIGYN